MRRILLLVAIILALTVAEPAAAATITVSSGGSLSAAYSQAAPGDEIVFDCGSYGAQSTPADSKAVTVRAQAPGCAKIRQLHSDASNITFDGLDLDASGAALTGAVFETGGSHDVTFKNGRIGNVVDEKGALLGGNVDPTPLNVVLDNVEFHDIRVVNPDTHNEAVYLMAPGTTIQNSRFCVDGSDCGSTGALLTQRGSWWGQQPWNGAKFLNNAFGHMMFDHGSLLFGNHCGDIGATCTDIEIRGNSFDSRSLPDNATPDLHYTNSFESCNTVNGAPATLNNMVGYGFVHEACGTPTPTPTPTATPTPSPTPAPTATVGRTAAGTTADWSGADEMDGWDFTAPSGTQISRICADTQAANSGVSSVDLGVYSNSGTHAKLASARFTGTPAGQFCVNVPLTTISGSVRIAWLPHGNRLNFKGTSGVQYVGITGKTSMPSTWPSGGGLGSVGAAIWAVG